MSASDEISYKVEGGSHIATSDVINARDKLLRPVERVQEALDERLKCFQLNRDTDG